MTRLPVAPVAQMAALTWHEARDLLSQHPIGILPVGALEAHGPHLPLDTDVVIAQAAALALGEAVAVQGVPAGVLPPVFYSASFVGTSFPGTTPVQPATVQRYVYDVLAGAASQGYRALIVCNAHLEPAHVDALKAAVAEADANIDIPVVFVDHRQEPHASRLSAEFAAGARHAGAYETAIMLAARPDAVRMDALSRLPAVWIDLPAALRAGARTFSEAGMTDAYVGDPASATAQEGEHLLATLAAIHLEALVERGVL